MFTGEHLSTIDTKGRTSIPVRFRDILSEGFGCETFVITKSSPVEFDDGTYGRGLSIYPSSEWQELERRIQANEGVLPVAQLNSLKRLVLGPAQVCNTDKVGRVLIPPALRVHASLDKDLYCVGMGKRFDLWSRETYLRVTSQDERNFPQGSDALAALGI